MTDAVTDETLKALLHYDPQTGAFTWLAGQRRGTSAGSGQSKGYMQIVIGGRKYYAHRLAWLYMTGKWPGIQIDHINGNKGDNRFSNLREVTPAQNQHNTGANKLNQSGFKGVSKRKKYEGWEAQIRINGKRTYLGTFSSPEEASAAYQAAAVEHQKNFRRAP